MPLFNKKPEFLNKRPLVPPKERLERIKQEAKEKTKEKPEKKPEEGFFGKKTYLKRPEAKEKFKQASPKFPGSAKWYTGE